MASLTRFGTFDTDVNSNLANFDSDSQCWCNVTLCQRWCKKQLLTTISGLDGSPIWVSTLWQLFVEFLQKVRINCCVLIFVDKMKSLEQLKKHPITPTQPSISRRLQPWELNLFYNLLMVVHVSLHHQHLFKRQPSYVLLTISAVKSVSTATANASMIKNRMAYCRQT